MKIVDEKVHKNSKTVSLQSCSSWALQCIPVTNANCGQYGEAQTESWMLGKAAEAHWAQGWASHVAAEPLQNELLARALPTGNVSSLAMWNRFQLEGTRAQSRCLGTQLSVPFFFQVASTVEKTLTCILCHNMTAGECTEDLNKTTMLFYLIP